jgi:Family of unknown function (DUF5654)
MKAAKRRRYAATLITMLSTAFAVTVGFAWNSAVQALNHVFFQDPRHEVLAAFCWAGGVTIVAVLLIELIGGEAPQELPDVPESS